MMATKFLHLHLLFFFGSLLAAQVYSKKLHGNPANSIADIINKNRTASKLSALYDSPGLACMALQYAQECKNNCTSNNTVSCQPLEDDFIEVFAPDCGVELPTFDTISGRIVGCWSKYLEPADAFSQLLVRDKRSLASLRNKTYTEVGVGLVSTHKGHFFWTVLFSNGQTKSSFILEDRGQGIKQKEGCFSGTNTTCNEAYRRNVYIRLSSFLGLFTSMFLYLIVNDVYILL